MVQKFVVKKKAVSALTDIRSQSQTEETNIWLETMQSTCLVGMVRLFELSKLSVSKHILICLFNRYTSSVSHNTKSESENHMTPTQCIQVSRQKEDDKS